MVYVTRSLLRINILNIDIRLMPLAHLRFSPLCFRPPCLLPFTIHIHKPFQDANFPRFIILSSLILSLLLVYPRRDNFRKEEAAFPIRDLDLCSLRETGRVDCFGHNRRERWRVVSKVSTLGLSQVFAPAPHRRIYLIYLHSDCSGVF